MIFGTTSFSARSLTQKFVSGLNSMQAKEDWTKEVLRVLRELGKKKHLYVSPDSEVGQRGYLLDMMWQKQRRDKKRSYPDVVLAIESERGRDRDDFEKLMHVKAPQKLFIFWSSPRKSGQECIQEMERDMEDFTQHVCGEEYVLVEFRTSECKAFRYEYRVPRNGKLRNVLFREIKPQISY